MLVNGLSRYIHSGCVSKVGSYACMFWLVDHGRWFWGNFLNHLCPREAVGNCRTGGEVWQSSGSVAGCCSLDLS